MIDWLSIRVPLLESACSLMNGSGRTSRADARCPGVMSFESRQLLNNMPWQGEVHDMKVDEDFNTVGSVSRLTLPWASLPSGYSNLAFKLWHEGKTFYNWPYVELRGSPAKVLTGHNAFGTGDIELCAIAMLHALMQAAPAFENMLDWEQADVGAIDLTASVQVPTEADKLAVLEALRTIEYRHTKGSQPYATTVYLTNRDSERRVNKVYDKHPEMLHQVKSMKRNHPERVAEVERVAGLDWVKRSLRFETRVKRKMLEDLGYSTMLFKPGGLIDTLGTVGKRTWLFNRAWQDTLKTLEGHHMTVITDRGAEKLIFAAHCTNPNRTAKARHLLEFYRNLQAYGYRQLKAEAAKDGDAGKRTFQRRIKDLADAGIPRAQLTAPTTSTVVPFMRLIDIDFGQQVPQGETLATHDTLKRFYAS